MNLIEPTPDRTQRALFRAPEDFGLQPNEEELRELIRKSDEFLRKSEKLKRLTKQFLHMIPC